MPTFILFFPVKEYPSKEEDESAWRREGSIIVQRKTWRKELAIQPVSGLHKRNEFVF